MSYRSILAETVAFVGYNGDSGEAYYARPISDGKFPGSSSFITCPAGTNGSLKWFPNLPTTAMRPSLHIFISVTVQGAPMTSAQECGPPAASRTLRSSATSRALWRSCVLSRTARGELVLSGSARGGATPTCAPAALILDAIVDCWGGNVIVDDKSQLNVKRPVAPIDLTEGLRCPLLGLFGNDDENPKTDEVNRTEAELKRLGKRYEFYRYDGAGHAFFNTARVSYRPEQAADGWAKVFKFLQTHLAA